MSTLWVLVLLICVIAIFVGGIMTILRGFMKMRDILRQKKSG